MKIVFICGSLEPGKDGVGDYTRKLAAEIARRGNSVAAVAIHDRYLIESEVLEQMDEGNIILRFGLKESLEVRFRLLHHWLKEWDPDWISLQFVPYAYHDKGLPWRLGGKLSRLGRGKKWHFMYHELWIEGKGFKTRLIAKLQQLIIADINKKLNPAVTHTNLPVYKSRLKEVEINSRKLPVFSNICGKKKSSERKTNFLMIAFFSQLTVREGVLSFLREFLKDISSFGFDYKILILGGSKEAKLKLEEALKLIPCVDNKLEIKGFLRENDLFKVISSCDMGITPVPQHVLGKSGSVAAFLSQGIPVAAPYSKLGYEHLKVGFLKKKLKKGIFDKPDLLHFQKAAKAAKRIPEKISVDTIAAKFEKDLIEVS